MIILALNVTVAAVSSPSAGGVQNDFVKTIFVERGADDLVLRASFKMLHTAFRVEVWRAS